MADHLTRPAQLRFFLLALALVPVFAALDMGQRSIAAREFGTLRRQFEKVQMESFRIADELISSVARPDLPASSPTKPRARTLDRQNFARDSRFLAGWLAAQSRRLHTPERQLLEQIDKEYAVYSRKGAN